MCSANGLVLKLTSVMVHWLHFNIHNMQNRSLCYTVFRRSNAVVVERSIIIVSLMMKD